MTLLLALLACSGADRPAPAADVASAAPAASAPDLAIVGVAGLRSDTQSRSGEWFLEAFAGERGVVFSNAYAQSPSTFVSLSSLLAGRYPSAVPICGFPSDPWEATGEPPWCTRWPEGVPSLPAVLALYGYRTALVTADVQGADRFAGQFQDVIVVSERWQDTATDWAAVQAAATKWWTADASRPRFVAIVVSDLNVRTNPGLRRDMGLDVVDASGAPIQINRQRVSGRLQAAAQAAGKGAKAIVDALRAGSPRPLWAAVMGTNGINLGDSAVPTQALRDRSWSDILVDRTLHVPLALVGPPDASPARVEDQVVELVDLLPTFLAKAGAVPPASIPGQDLLADPFVADPAATAYAEFGDMLAVRSGTRMYSVRAFFYNRSALDPELTNFVIDYRPDPGKYWLNDLASDPFQERNLLQADPEGARRMNDLLVKIRTGPGAPPDGALDARRIWELRMAPADGYW